MTLYFEEEGAVTLPLDCEKTGRVAVETALDILGCPYEAEVSLLLTTNEEIHRMNLEFRDVDRPTDVLSFPMIDFAVPGILMVWKSGKIASIRKQASCPWAIS